MLTAKQNERLTRVGPGTPCGALMRRYWLPIAASSQLPGPGTRAVRILGEELVLYRDRQGRLGLLEPQCAHRRAGLVFGIPEAQGLRCTYHGWCYDASGQCVEQPYEAFLDPASTFKERIRIKAYPVEELGGLVFAYLGPEPRPLLPRWEALVREDLKREVGIVIVPCNWLQAVENAFDGSHLVYTHGRFSSYVCERLGRQESRESPGDRGFAMCISQDDTTVEMPFGFGHFAFPYIDVHADSYQMRVPVDDTHTLLMYYMFYTPEDERSLGVEIPPQPDPTCVPFFEVPVPGLDHQGEPQWSLLDSNIGQDLVMWYSQGAVVDRTQEHLGAGDRSIVKMRLEIEKQIQIIEQGGDPINTFRDPAENQCLVPPLKVRIPMKTSDGRPNRMYAVRKYSPVYRAAAVRASGEAVLSEPVR